MCFIHQMKLEDKDDFKPDLLFVAQIYKFKGLPYEQKLIILSIQIKKYSSRYEIRENEDEVTE